MGKGSSFPDGVFRALKKDHVRFLSIVIRVSALNSDFTDAISTGAAIGNYPKLPSRSEFEYRVMFFKNRREGGKTPDAPKMLLTYKPFRSRYRLSFKLCPNCIPVQILNNPILNPAKIDIWQETPYASPP